MTSGYHTSAAAACIPCDAMPKVEEQLYQQKQQQQQKSEQEIAIEIAEAEYRELMNGMEGESKANPPHLL